MSQEIRAISVIVNKVVLDAPPGVCLAFALNHVPHLEQIRQIQMPISQLHCYYLFYRPTPAFLALFVYSIPPSHSVPA
jgi:hypothetical protein